MKDIYALIGVTMLVLLGGSIAEYVANHKGFFTAVGITIFAVIFIYSVIKSAKTSK